MSEVSLRDYIEAILEERLRGHRIEHALIDQALEKTDERVDDRLEKFEARLQPLEDFRSKAIGFGALLAVVSGVVGAIVRGFFG